MVDQISNIITKQQNNALLNPQSNIFDNNVNNISGINSKFGVQPKLKFNTKIKVENVDSGSQSQLNHTVMIIPHAL